MSIISISNLVKDYESNGLTVRALRGVECSVESGEFTAIAGPSGSGKTTLLNIIGGLDLPTSGGVTVAGSDLTAMSARELSDMRLLRIGFIFQAYNLIPVLTAIENVEYILLLQGVGREERRGRAARVLDDVGLSGEMNRLPRELSGGQQQRVAVARAIVSEPAIVLADEPTANLDQKTGAGLLDLMHGLNREKGITFIFSTHDRMVMERAERLVSITDGTITSDVRKKGKRR
ncbi:MAG: ABC transporter ATP-binding protein [Spirochaetes bacterium]|nr:ABC transporter ATP-binding protein [Spirochaetota bacterium]